METEPQSKDQIWNIKLGGKIENVVDLTELDALTAEVIVEKANESAPELLLINLKSINPEVARILSGYKYGHLGGGLHLDGLYNIDEESLRELVKFEGTLLDLSGLGTLPGFELDVEKAKILATWGGEKLDLGVFRVSPEAARELVSGSIGYISFPNLKIRDNKELQEALAGFSGNFDTRG